MNTPRFVRAATLILLSLPAALAAQRPASQSGFDPARLARVDTFLQRYVDSNRVAGAVALVLRDGKVVYERGVGFADREAGRKMTPDIIFRIASQSKAVTSVAALMLVEEGKLALSDPVSRFIPAFAHTTVALRADSGHSPVPAKRQITIKDLLTHTAGVSYGTDAIIAQQYAAKGLGSAAGSGWYVMDKDEPICTTMERLATVPFVAQPGEAFVYGYSIDILGCVVERASGKPLDEFIRSRITAPLGMKDTYFYLPPEKRARLAAVYFSDSTSHAARAPDGVRGQGHFVDGPRRSFGGGAGMLSTAHDYGIFLEMLRNHGALNGVRILSPKMVDLMTTPQIAVYQAVGKGFGLGFETVEKLGADGLSSVGTFSWGGAYGSNYRVDPAEGLAILFMINQLPARTDIGAKFPTLVYQALVAPRVGASVVQR